MNTRWVAAIQVFEKSNFRGPSEIQTDPSELVSSDEKHMNHYYTQVISAEMTLHIAQTVIS